MYLIYTWEIPRGKYIIAKVVENSGVDAILKAKWGYKPLSRESVTFRKDARALRRLDGGGMVVCGNVSVWCPPPVSSPVIRAGLPYQTPGEGIYDN